MFPDEVVTRQDPNKRLELENKWKSFFQNPVNRAILLQTGIQLLQPMAHGQSPIGHMAASLGSGLAVPGRVAKAEEAARQSEHSRRMDQARLDEQTRNREQDALNAEQQRKIQLRQLEQSGQIAQQGAAIDRERLGLEKQRVQNDQERINILSGRSAVSAEQLQQKRDQARAAYVAKILAGYDESFVPVEQRRTAQELATEFDSVLWPAMQGGLPGGSPASGQPTPGGTKQISRADLMETATKYGMSPEEVLSQLEAQGLIVELVD